MSVIVVRPRASGGLAAHVDQELRVLAADGIEIREAGVDIQDRPRPGADLRTVRALRRLIASTRPDALHAHGLRAGALSALAVGRCSVGRRSRTRLVVTLHNRTVGGRAVRLIGAALLRVLVRSADTVLAVSPDLAEGARAAGARDVRHAIIPAPDDAGTGADPGHHGTPERAPSTAGAALDVLVIARLAPQKGLDDLLDAAAQLPDAHTDSDAHTDRRIRIRVAGDGPLHACLAARIDAEELPVELLGRREDVGRLLAEADLVVSSALWEGQPVSLQEALRAGRAIVATDAGGTRWVTGDAAHLVPVGDAQALAAAIRVHLDDEVRAAAEQASRERAAQLPDARDMSEQLRTVLVPPKP